MMIRITVYDSAGNVVTDDEHEAQMATNEQIDEMVAANRERLTSPRSGARCDVQLRRQKCCAANVVASSACGSLTAGFGMASTALRRAGFARVVSRRGCLGMGVDADPRLGTAVSFHPSKNEEGQA